MSDKIKQVTEKICELLEINCTGISPLHVLKALTISSPNNQWVMKYDSERFEIIKLKNFKTCNFENIYIPLDWARLTDQPEKVINFLHETLIN